MIYKRGECYAKIRYDYMTQCVMFTGYMVSAGRRIVVRRNPTPSKLTVNRYPVGKNVNVSVVYYHPGDPSIAVLK